jgi:3-deoxy-alpha-D-manno-octulosonate 8-oxidase
MKEKHEIELPKDICGELPLSALEKMAQIALSMEPLWENALGKNWSQKIDEEKLISIYRKM